jgi:hypothetical protein
LQNRSACEHVFIVCFRPFSGIVFRFRHMRHGYRATRTASARLKAVL